MDFFFFFGVDRKLCSNYIDLSDIYITISERFLRARTGTTLANGQSTMSAEEMASFAPDTSRQTYRQQVCQPVPVFYSLLCALFMNWMGGFNKNISFIHHSFRYIAF